MDSRYSNNKFNHQYTHTNMPQSYPLPPPHFRRRFSSESAASSTIESGTAKGFIKRNISLSNSNSTNTSTGTSTSNKRKSDDSYTIEERRHEDNLIKRRMTSRDSRDEDFEESRDMPSSPSSSTLGVVVTPSQAQMSRNIAHREVKRVGSSELASAMALASLAYGTSSSPRNSSTIPSSIHRPRQTQMLSYSRSQQELFMKRSLSNSSSFSRSGHLDRNTSMNDIHEHHTQGHNQSQIQRYPDISMQARAYYNRYHSSASSPQSQSSQPNKRQWVCDYCNEASFDTFEAACKHEKSCSFNPSVTVSNSQMNMSMNMSGGDVGQIGQSGRHVNTLGGTLGKAQRSYGPDNVLSGRTKETYFEGKISLAVASTDSDWLSETNCFVRSTCVEAFSAEEEDIMVSSKRGRISLYQVGIRCKFCSKQDAKCRASGAVSFPVSVTGIYESVKRWKSVHLSECKFIPTEIKEKIKNMEKAACVPTTRQYWIDSAKALGIDDTPDGLRFVNDPAKFNQVDAQSSMVKTRFAPSSAKMIISDDGKTTKKEEYIVFPEDKSTITPYVYCLMRQVQPCIFTEADRFLSRSKSSVGFAGFECRHCNGHAGLGRYFPSTPKALSTNSTSQNIFSHVQKCRKCPDEVKEELKALKLEKPTWLRRTCGWRQAFFEKLWERLHG